MSIALLALAPLSLHAQATVSGPSDEIVARTASSSTNGAGPVGIVPLLRGFNASLGTSSQHDSSNGWSSVLTPGIAWRFNKYLAVNASIPIYTYINIDENKGTVLKPKYQYVPKHGVPGDTSLAVAFDAPFRPVSYSTTVSLGLPSGNDTYGLGAGQVTYDFNNHFEKTFGILTPDIELGIGNSSSLVRTRVRKSYVAVGTLSHFQAGTSVDLPFNMSFEADAYEILPITPDTVYSTTGSGKRKVTTIVGKTAAEDNGFNTNLDIPINGHVTLSGFYNRSLRNHDDVAGFSFTFLLKAPPKIVDAR